MATLVAQERTDFRKSTLKQARREGKIPAVVYGSDIDTHSIFIKNNNLLKVIKNVGRHGIFSLDISGNAKDVILREYQTDEITRDILHVDLLQVDQDTEIDAKVSVVLTGTAEGEKSGGIVQLILHELDIKAKANDIPDAIEIDVTELEIGQGIQIADIKEKYSKVTFQHEDDETIVLVDVAKEVPEEDSEEAQAESQPEDQEPANV